MRTTDSVNKSPGPIQRALMKRAYEKFLVHAGRSSPQSPPRAALPICRLLRASHRLHDALYCAGRPGHKDTLRTYLRPPHLTLTRPVRPDQLGAWVSSIHGLNQKITPSTSGGHAQSQVQSSRAFSPSPEARLTRTEALVSFRVLNRIKPQHPVHVWNSANFFKFHSCGHTLQETRRLCFRLGHARALGRSLRAHTASQQSLWLGLLRSLIVIDTPTLVLGRRASPRWALSPPVVLAGSANSTSRQPVLPPSNFSLLC